MKEIKIGKTYLDLNRSKEIEGNTRLMAKIEDNPQNREYENGDGTLTVTERSSGD